MIQRGVLEYHWVYRRTSPSILNRGQLAPFAKTKKTYALEPEVLQNGQQIHTHKSDFVDEHNAALECAIQYETHREIVSRLCGAP